MTFVSRIIFIILCIYIIDVQTESLEDPITSITAKTSPLGEFSGIYTLKTLQSRAERFAAAWLTKKSTFLREEYINDLQNAKNIESVTLSLIDGAVPIMTRDFFDFQVLHLSTLTNQIPSFSDKMIRSTLIDQMNSTAMSFKEATRSIMSNINDRRARLRPRLSSTVVIIPYTSVPGSQVISASDQSEIQFNQQLRLLYLQSCVLSVYKYFPRIIIATLSENDATIVKNLNLPVWNYLDLSEDIKGNPMALPKVSCLRLQQCLLNNELACGIGTKNDWESTHYVYYTEMDQILYFRYMKQIYNILDQSRERHVVMVPHRLNSIALPKAFPSDEPWRIKSKDKKYQTKLDDLQRVNVAVLDVVSPQGSCCDDGRFNFEYCGGFWTSCLSYGIQNYSTWLRFGNNGFTTPSGSGHRARCQYSPVKLKCPLPKNCTGIGIDRSTNNRGICGEIDKYIIIPEFNRTKRLY